MLSQLNKEAIATALREYRQANRSISYHICNNSKTFSKLWNNGEIRVRIKEMAREYLEERGTGIYYVPSIHMCVVLFIPQDYTSIGEDIAVREDFLKYLKAKLS